MHCNSHCVIYYAILLILCKYIILYTYGILSAPFCSSVFRGVMQGDVSLPFFENRKKRFDFGKKAPNSIHLWIKFSIQNVVLRSQNTFFFLKLKNTVFYIKLWKNHTWIEISNLMVFSMKKRRYEDFRFWGFLFPNLNQFS